MGLLTSFTGASSVSGLTRTATCNATIPVGSLVAVTTANNGGVSPSSVTDNKGNTYTQRASAPYTSNTITVTEYVCIVTTQLVSTDVVTSTYAVARSSASLVVGAWDDQPAVTTLDVAASTALGNSSSPALGPTADPPAAKALVIAGYGVQGSALSYTPTSTQLAVGYASPGTAGSDRAAAMSYEYVTNPGASSVAGTFGAVANWVGELIVLAVPSAVTSTVAFTEDDDTAAVAAAEDVSSTAAWSEDDDAVAAAATETITGTAAWSEADDTVAATSAEDIAATAAWSEDSDTVTGAAAESITASSAWTEDDDTVTAAATFAPPAGSAVVAWTEDDDVLVAAMAENISATAAWTEADDAVVVAAAETISASVAWTEADDSAVAAAAENVAASGSWTDADDSLVAAASFASPALDVTAAWTEADDSIVASAAFLGALVGVPAVGSSSVLPDGSSAVLVTAGATSAASSASTSTVLPQPSRAEVL